MAAANFVYILGDAAEHCRKNRSARRHRRIEEAGVQSVAKHRNAVGDLEDLVEVVGNVDDRDRLLLQSADDAEDEFGFVFGERRGRLVHDEDAGASGERARDLDNAPLGDRQSMHEPIRLDRAEAELFEERAGALANCGIIDDAKARAGPQRQIGDAKYSRRRSCRA